ncbi:hypothetical protein MIR68_001445 [Amoeboaphelidium protococcarum]|nr:hypothetical protein MIR68_001445 [Amoeboaphelidium protococcarum]
MALPVELLGSEPVFGGCARKHRYDQNLVSINQQNAQLNEFWLEHGITSQFTTPYVHQRNGVVEAKNRSLMDGIRQMVQCERTFNTAIAYNTYASTSVHTLYIPDGHQILLHRSAIRQQFGGIYIPQNYHEQVHATLSCLPIELLARRIRYMATATWYLRVVLSNLPSMQEPRMIEANYASVTNIGKELELLLRNFTRIFGSLDEENFAGFLVIYDDSFIIDVQEKLAQSLDTVA